MLVSLFWKVQCQHNRASFVCWHKFAKVFQCVCSTHRVRWLLDWLDLLRLIDKNILCHCASLSPYWLHLGSSSSRGWLGSSTVEQFRKRWTRCFILMKCIGQTCSGGYISWIISAEYSGRVLTRCWWWWWHYIDLSLSLPLHRNCCCCAQVMVNNVGT